MAVSAILLAAGYATRMYPLTHDTPKALLPLGSGVILDRIVSGLGSEVTKRILVTNHKFVDQFRAWRGGQGVELEIIDNGTETAETRLGAIRDLELARVQGRAEGDLLVIGTDNVLTWSLHEFIAKARRHAPHPSVALWEAPSTEAATQFGVVRRDAQSRIVEFVEKSPQPPSREVATCLYYFPEAMCGRIQEFISSGGNTEAPGHFIKWLASHGAAYGIMMGGGWYDIGSLETYETIKREWPGGEG